MTNSFLPEFIAKQMAEGQTHGQFQACTMFMDLSGFTALTAKLMEKGPEGAEELSYALNHIFEPMVSAVYAAGGMIPYFAGDSFTAIFDLDSEPNAATQMLHVAHEISLRFQREVKAQDRLIGQYNISIKIGLGSGNVEWGIAGRNRKAFYFFGEAIEACAQAQVRAKKGEIYIHQELCKSVQQYLATKPTLEEQYLLVDEIKVKKLPPLEARPPEVNERIKTEVLAQYFPKEILQQADNTGEFRNVTSVFIAFGKFDDHSLLDRFAAMVLEQSLEFSGYFKEIDFGDKGGVMCILFGAPVAFENNTERALEFIMTIEDELHSDPLLSEMQWRIGVSSGIAFSGIIGGKERSQYAVVGARVNLAARLMASAPWKAVVTDENVQRNRNYRFESLGERLHKGFSDPIESYQLIGRNQTLKTGYSGHYVGRQEELKQLLQASEPLGQGKFAGVTAIFGEPGIGKSRLSWEFRKALSSKMQIRWMVCRSDQILRKPFNPFLLFLKNYFDQKADQSPEEHLFAFGKNIEELKSDLAECQHPQRSEIGAELVKYQYVLAALAGVKEPESAWPKLDGRTRYQLALQALSILIQAEACVQPVVIELEDAHWYDEMSKEFLQEFVRKAVQFPILFHVASRYEDDGSKIRLFNPLLYEQYKIPHTEIDLRYLSIADMTAFAESRLDGMITEELSELLYRMSQGNPFYAEQLLEYFKEMHILAESKGIYSLKNADIRISDSVKEIMMARIDRLSSLVKETVKAAAVIGREFEVDILTKVMAHHMEFIKRNGDLGEVLHEQIRTAEQGQIWHAVNELRYIFKHSLLREAAYDMQLHTRLRDLHKLIAKVIETQYPNNEERYFDLAFHYEQAGARKPMEKYLELAGKYAQRNYQNRQALICYDKLLQSYPGSAKKKQIKVWLRRGSVHELIGQWDQALENYETALLRAMDINDAKLMGRSYRRLGQLLMLRGEYDRARQHFEQAVLQFGIDQNPVGTAKTLGNMGALFFRQGKYEEAKQKFIETIELNRKHGREIDNAPFVANLGLVAMNQSNYDEAIQRLEYQIEVNQAAGDKQGLTTLYTNLGIIYLEKGMLSQARHSLERGLALSEELDNKLFMTICIGSLGKVWERSGDYVQAMQLYERDLALVQELGDKQGQAIAHHLIGELKSILGITDAGLHHLHQSVAFARQLNYKKGLAKALNALGDLHFTQKQLNEAMAAYTEALDLCRQTGYKLLHAETIIELGEVFLAFGKYDNALQQFQLAAPMVAEMENEQLNFAHGLLNVHLLSANGQEALAEAEIERLAQLFESEPDRIAVLKYEAAMLYPGQKNLIDAAKTALNQLMQGVHLASYDAMLSDLETLA